MGYKQLLLIALGVIVVSIAVTVGFEMFSVSYDDMIKDMALIRFNELGVEANKYYKKPKDLGGGGGSYVGFEVPSALQGDELAWINRTKPKKNRIDMYIISTPENYSGSPFYIQGRYTPEGLQWIKLYDPEKSKWRIIYDRN